MTMGRLNDRNKFIHLIDNMNFWVLVFILYVLFSLDKTNANDDEGVIFFNETSFNWTKLYELPKKTIFIVSGETPGDELNNLDQLKGMRRGNIQDKCRRSLFTKYDVSPTTWFNFVDYNDPQYKLSAYPFYLGFSPLSEVYGINKHCYSGEYQCPRAGERYVFLGTYENVIMKGNAFMPLQEAGVLPWDSKFWVGTGCRNWKSGKGKNPKKDKGKIGSSEYQYNFKNVDEVLCNNYYYWLCIGVSEAT